MRKFLGGRLAQKTRQHSSAPVDPFHQRRAEADAARDRKAWSLAADLYEAALKHRDDTGIRIQLGHMRKEEGRLDLAETAYFEALAARPDDAELLLQIGHFYWVKREPAQSVEFYRRAVALAPDNPMFRRELAIGEERLAAADLPVDEQTAMAAVAQRDWPTAESHLRLLVAHGRTRLLIILAHTVKEQGRIEEAASLYRQNLELQQASGAPEDVLEAELQLAMCLKLQRRFSEAAAMFASARQTRLDIEGWVGSTDDLGAEVAYCLARVHPTLQAPFG